MVARVWPACDAYAAYGECSLRTSRRYRYLLRPLFLTTKRYINKNASKLLSTKINTGFHSLVIFVIVVRVVTPVDGRSEALIGFATPGHPYGGGPGRREWVHRF
jgi:hypothetical protein